MQWNKVEIYLCILMYACFYKECRQNVVLIEFL